MTIYIAADGNWGDAYDMALIDDSKWSDADYVLIQEWNERTLLAYAEAVSENPKTNPTPTEWEKQQ